MHVQGFLGIAALLVLAWALSEQRQAISPRLVLSGLGLQFLFAGLLLGFPSAQAFFLGLNQAVVGLQEATQTGTAFVFGYLGGGTAPFEIPYPQHRFILAFQALPLLLVVSALSALLFYWRVLPLLIQGFAWMLRRTLGIGGALGFAAAANIFVGMVESPLLIRPYLRHLSRSELFALMTCGMATVAGTVMVLYASILEDSVPGALGQVLSASLISAPAALLIAGILVPETERTLGEENPFALPQQDQTAMEALTRGTLEAIPLFLHIIALLIVFIALVSLVNSLLSFLPQIGGEALTLQRLLGWVMAPVVWLIGIPWEEAQTAGSLMGIKTVLNELIAYLELAALPPEALSERSRLILLYALCGFANFGSLAILTGGLGCMVPERREEIMALGMKSILAGTLATLMTGAVAGIFL